MRLATAATVSDTDCRASGGRRAELTAGRPAPSNSALERNYSISDRFRLVDDDSGLQPNFMAQVHGVKSFESLRSRATAMQLGATSLCVAALADIVKSKRAAGRPRDRAVLPVLEKTLEQSRKRAKGRPEPRRSAQGPPPRVGAPAGRPNPASARPADAQAHALLATPAARRPIRALTGARPVRPSTPPRSSFGAEHVHAAHVAVRGTPLFASPRRALPAAAPRQAGLPPAARRPAYPRRGPKC
jgi:hypothetical protein